MTTNRNPIKFRFICITKRAENVIMYSSWNRTGDSRLMADLCIHETRWAKYNQLVWDNCFKRNIGTD